MSGKLYVVTGANGYIASALVKSLVDGGRHVRATVRRQEAGEALRGTLAADAKGQLEIAIVQDISSPGAFKEALQGATHVFHMASPLPSAGKVDAKRDFLDPALAGTLTLLQDAQSTPTVQKVVLTSSVASILDQAKFNTGGSFTESDWNPVTYDQAAKLGEQLAVADPETYVMLSMAIYAASKKVAEEAAWKFVRENKVDYALSAVHPSLVIGKPTMKSADGLTSGTNGMFWQLLNTRPVKPENTTTGYVDLRDVVEGHIQAMERKEADGGRFLLIGGQPMNHELINWAKQHNDSLPFGKVDVPADADEIKRKVTRFDTSASQKVLGIRYKLMQQTVADFVDWAAETGNAGKL